MPWKDRAKRLAYKRKYNKIYFARPEVKKKKKEYQKKYYSKPEVKKRQREYQKKYYSKQEVKKKKKEYQKRPEVVQHRIKRLKDDPVYKKRKHLRAKVRGAVIHQRCYISTIHKLIGCDVPTARQHLEAQFEPWMTWENYGRGKGKWSIDHIVRVASIDIFDEDEVKRIFHYTNMRPLCFIKNCEDSDKGRAFSESGVTVPKGI